MIAQQQGLGRLQVKDSGVGQTEQIVSLKWATPKGSNLFNFILQLNDLSVISVESLLEIEAIIGLGHRRIQRLQSASRR